MQEKRENVLKIASYWDIFCVVNEYKSESIFKIEQYFKRL
jgi:hypothetical protein